MLLPSFFGCGYVAPDGPEKSKYIVRDLSHLTRYIIAFFQAYPLRTVKGLDFQDFAAVAAMMARKERPQYLWPRRRTIGMAGGGHTTLRDYTWSLILTSLFQFF